MDMICWMDGQYVEAEKLRISPFDHGFLYGVGFFETFRTYDGHVLRLTDHLERLQHALADYRITIPYSEKQLRQVIQQLNHYANGDDGYFRLNVSAGVHDVGLAPSSYDQPTVIMFRKALPPTVRGTEKIATWLMTPRNEPESFIRHKSHNFMNNVRGRLELTSLKEQEGFFVTSQGYVAEGVTSNIFWVTDGVLYTPAIATGILPGTTRQLLLHLAQEMDIPVREGFFRKKDVEQADEVFVTNAVQELVPIKQLADNEFSGASGKYYQQLHNAYIDEINRMKESEQ